VALTGSAAISNSRAGDDLDLMILTKVDTLWLIRPVIVLLTEILFRRRRPRQGRQLRNAVCLNLWLDEAGMGVPQEKRNLYTAHEVLQLIPLVNKGQTYEKFLVANSWVSKFLANAWWEKRAEYQLDGLTKTKTQSGWQGLNRLAFRVQHQYMRNKITKEAVGLHSAYFHPQDWHESINQHLRRKANRE
jgi:hypothetical protein